MTVTEEELEKLLLGYRGLVKWCLKPFWNLQSPRYDRDDLLQVANMALIKVIYDYDETCPVNLTTVICKRVPSIVGRFVRKNVSSFSTSVEFDYSTNLPAVDNLDWFAKEGSSLGELIGKCDEGVELMMLVDAAERICMRNKEYGVANFNAWKMWRIDGYKQCEIADSLGISRQALSEKMVKIESRLRKEYCL